MRVSYAQARYACTCTCTLLGHRRFDASQAVQPRACSRRGWRNRRDPHLARRAAPRARAPTRELEEAHAGRRLWRRQLLTVPACSHSEDVHSGRSEDVHSGRSEDVCSGRSEDVCSEGVTLQTSARERAHSSVPTVCPGEGITWSNHRAIWVACGFRLADDVRRRPWRQSDAGQHASQRRDESRAQPCHLGWHSGLLVL